MQKPKRHCPCPEHWFKHTCSATVSHVGPVRPSTTQGHLQQPTSGISLKLACCKRSRHYHDPCDKALSCPAAGQSQHQMMLPLRQCRSDILKYLLMAMRVLSGIGALSSQAMGGQTGVQGAWPHTSPLARRAAPAQAVHGQLACHIRPAHTLSTTHPCPVRGCEAASCLRKRVEHFDVGVMACCCQALAHLVGLALIKDHRPALL